MECSGSEPGYPDDQAVPDGNRPAVLPQRIIGLFGDGHAVRAGVGTGRRVGHGKLVQRSLFGVPVIRDDLGQAAALGIDGGNRRDIPGGVIPMLIPIRRIRIQYSVCALQINLFCLSLSFE